MKTKIVNDTGEVEFPEVQLNQLKVRHGVEFCLIIQPGDGTSPLVKIHAFQDDALLGRFECEDCLPAEKLIRPGDVAIDAHLCVREGACAAYGRALEQFLIQYSKLDIEDAGDEIHFALSIHIPGRSRFTTTATCDHSYVKAFMEVT